MDHAAHARVPAHLWLIGGLSLLWNAYGGFDYLMKQTANPTYLAGFTDQQQAYFDSFPIVMDAAWAFGVWGAVLGSVLLVLRSSFATLAFGVSIFGLLGSTFYEFAVLNPPAELMTTGMMAMTIAVWTIAVVLFYYARAMSNLGWLR